MTVADPNRPPPQLAQKCDQVITTMKMTQDRVEHYLKVVDIRKASGPDDVSSQVLHHCSSERQDLSLRCLPLVSGKTRDPPYGKWLAHQASLRVSALRGVADFLDERGFLTLYKVQVRPYLEYEVLTWMSSAAPHLWRLDKVERRMQRLWSTIWSRATAALLPHRIYLPWTHWNTAGTLVQWWSSTRRRYRRCSTWQDLGSPCERLWKTRERCSRATSRLECRDNTPANTRGLSLPDSLDCGMCLPQQLPQSEICPPNKWRWLLTGDEDHSPRSCYYKVSSSAFEIVPRGKVTL